MVCALLESEKEKSFLRNFESRVKKTIRNYALLEEGDKVIVACSGGKDSTTVLYLLNKFGFEPTAFTIDLGIGDYSKKNLANLKLFCSQFGINLHETSLQKEIGCSLCYALDALKEKGERLPSCTVCGVLRRWIINKRARELGATKLATGHNLDDEAQAFLMNLSRGDLSKCGKMGPKSSSSNEKLVARIKPLYFCAEEEVERYSRLRGFPVLYEKCPCSANVYRRFVKNKLDEIEARQKGAKRNLVESLVSLTPAFRGLEKQEKQLKSKSTNSTKSTNFFYCKQCGEPSAKELCNACRLLAKVFEK